jgi:hypothetical protein
MIEQIISLVVMTTAVNAVVRVKTKYNHKNYDLYVIRISMVPGNSPGPLSIKTNSCFRNLPTWQSSKKDVRCQLHF